MSWPDGIPLRGVPSVAPDPVAGDKGCVLAAASAPGVTDRAYGGPVARYVWDLADRDASGWIVPIGASGVPDDEHFADQTGDWLAGRLRRVGPTASTVTRVRSGARSRSRGRGCARVSAWATE